MTNYSEIPNDPATSLEDRRQRNLLIGLSVGAVIVLLAGMIAFVATRGNDGGETRTTGPATTTAITVALPVPATASTSTVSAAPISTSTTTTTPILANADAGADLTTSSNGEFTLTAVGLADGTPDAAVRWTQTAGPDATAGVGFVRGASAVAIAPGEVSTLVFELKVAGTDGVAVDEVVVRVFEDAEQTAFVDGERGDDAGDGSVESPFRSITQAVADAAGRDVYVRSVGIYDSTAGTLDLGAGVNLYGGFDESWNRDVDQRAVINGASTALRLSGGGERWVSAIELTSGDAEHDVASIALEIVDADVVHVEDSRIVAGPAGAAQDVPTGVHSIGLFARNATEIRIERTTVNGGQGSNGRPGTSVVDDDVQSGDDGADGSGRNAGMGATATAGSGGAGGGGGQTSNGTSAPGGGGAGGTVVEPNGKPGDGGSGGAGGAGGNGAVGAGDSDGSATLPLGGSGETGVGGSSGEGGLGGGGGLGPVLVNGGGGGGGGAGGEGSSGAPGGGGAGGSAGVWVVQVERLVIIESLVAGGKGGDGGSGSIAAPAGDGGAGGSGADGVDGVFADGGNGGGAGGAGAGGRGGQGGGGAGGSSYGLLTTDVGVVEVSASTIRGGGGGRGADGGSGGRSGNSGLNGTGQSGGAGGSGSDGAEAGQGDGAGGGSSYGWFDDSGADQVLDGAEFIEGTAGRGGSGASVGDDGATINANV